jgi:hypothetical protein
MLRRLSILILGCALATLALPSRACILEFRSADWQVAESPLVIVGQVTKTAPDPIPPQFATTFRNGLIAPSAATVTIQRLLKGNSPSPTLIIHCGPIRSCAPYPVHLQADVGKSFIFILTPSADDSYQLAWAGSLQDLAALPAIQDSIARCDAWRTDYLDRMGKQNPAMMQAAIGLDAALLTAAKTWPQHAQEALTPGELLHGISDDAASTATVDSLLKTLQATDPSTIQTALAIDFARPAGWSRHPLWQDASLRYADAHTKEIATLHQAEWTRLLTIGGATPAQIHDYFSRVDQEEEPLAFPIPLPDPFTHIRGENLTTDFLLRSQGFDRGQLYFSYGLQPDALATLDRQRVKTLIPVLLASSNDHLKWAATTALAEMR